MADQKKFDLVDNGRTTVYIVKHNGKHFDEYAETDEVAIAQYIVDALNEKWEREDALKKTDDEIIGQFKTHPVSLEYAKKTGERLTIIIDDKEFVGNFPNRDESEE